MKTLKGLISKVESGCDIKQSLEKFKTFYFAAVLFLIFLLYGLLTYNYTYLSGDLGEYVNNALRVYNGEIPYRDFWLLFPPGEVYLPAWLYRIFGLNINVVLISWPMVAALVGVASFVFGKILFFGMRGGSFFSFILAVLMFFNGLVHVHFLFMLLAAMFFVGFLRSDGRLKLFVSGIFTGMAFYFRFFEVAAFVLAVEMVLLANFMGVGGRLSGIWRNSLKFLKYSLIFGSGTLAVALILYFPLLEYWKFIIQSVFFDSLSHGTSMNLPYFDLVKSSWKILKMSREVDGVDIYSLASFLRTFALYLLPFFVLFFSIFSLFVKQMRKNDKLIVLFLMLWLVFELPKGLGRSDISHLAHAVSPALILLIFFLGKFKSIVGSLFVGIFVVLLLFQAPIKVCDVADLLKAEQYLVSTRYGHLFIADENDAKNILKAIDFIEANSDEGQNIFVSSWDAPAYYALTNRKNPTYYDSLIDLVAQPSEDKQKRVCEGLLGQAGDKNAFGGGAVKVIIHNPDFGFDGKEELSFRKTNVLLQKCIEKNFKKVGRAGGDVLYLRKYDRKIKKK